MALDPQLEQLLNEYEKAPIPGGNPSEFVQSNSPLALTIGNQRYTFNSPQEMQATLDQSFSRVGQAVQTMEQRILELEATNAELAKRMQPPPKPKNPENAPPVDSMDFASGLATDAGGAIAQAAEKDPRIAEAIIKNSPQFRQLEERMEFQAFEKAHPFYAGNQQVMRGLTEFVKQNNLPVNSKTLEMAAGLAVTNGHLPHENELRRMQQEAFVKQYGGQVQNPTPQNQGFQQNTQTYNPLPAPPRVGGGSNGQQPTMEERIDKLFKNRNLSTAEMKNLLVGLETTNFSG